MDMKSTPKYRVEVELEQYIYYQGYRNTEEFDGFDSDDIYTAEDYWQDFEDKDTFDPRRDQKYYVFKVAMYPYAVDADGKWSPMYEDDPVATSEYQVDEDTPYFAEKYAKEDNE